MTKVPSASESTYTQAVIFAGTFTSMPNAAAFRSTASQLLPLRPVTYSEEAPPWATVLLVLGAQEPLCRNTPGTPDSKS